MVMNRTRAQDVIIQATSPLSMIGAAASHDLGGRRRGFLRESGDRAERAKGERAQKRGAGR